MAVTPACLRRVLGLLAVVLALAARLASGTVVADVDAGQDMAALLDTMIQCHADALPPSPSEPARRSHPEPDRGLCALASVLDLPAPILADAPALPPRRMAPPLRLALSVTGRAQPSHPPGAALPRGPPILL